MGPLQNPRHERLAQELANGAVADIAYVTAGYKKNRFNAAAMARQEHILVRVAEILNAREQLHGQSSAAALEKATLTKEWIITRLRENVERAMQAIAIVDSKGNPTGEYRYDGSVANKALELLGKELGMFIERREVRTGALDGLPADTLAAAREQLIAARDRRLDRGVREGYSGKPN